MIRNFRAYSTSTFFLGALTLSFGISLAPSPALALPGGVGSAAAGASSGATSAATSAACSAGASAIASAKSTYATNVALYNTSIAMLKAQPIESAKKTCASAGKSLHDTLPTVETALEKLRKVLFQKDGDERRIIDWIIFGGSLSDALTDLEPRLEKLLPMLKDLDDPKNGLTGMATSLSLLQAAVAGAPTLDSTLDSCSDFTAAKAAFPKAQTLTATGLDSVTRALSLAQSIQDNMKKIKEALKSAQGTFDPARDRVKKLIGDDLDATERRTLAVFLPAAPLIYTGEFLKDKLKIGKDRLRTFAGVSEDNWKILHTKKNSDAVAKAIRETVFEKIKTAEDAVSLVDQAVKSYESQLPGIIKDLTSAQTGLATVAPKVSSATFPSIPCQDCWF